MGLPSKQTASPSSTCAPMPETTWPLTVTRPAAMYSSHFLREATPQEAMYFCSLMFSPLLSLLSLGIVRREPVRQHALQAAAVGPARAHRLGGRAQGHAGELLLAGP